MTGPSLAQVVADIGRVLPAGAVVKVGIEAAGHYHRPLLLAGAWPAGWEVLELNPGHVTEQRRVLGKRTIKTDVIDLQAMTELLLAGRGQPVRDRSLVLGELTAWSAHRTGRVVVADSHEEPAARAAGSDLPRPDPGPARRAGHQGRPAGRGRVRRPGPARRVGAAAGSSGSVPTRGLQIRKAMADRLVQAARDALPTADAAVARAVLAADLALLADLDAQVDHATDQLARLLPVSPFAPLLSVPGWGPVRAGNYGGALGDPARFDNHSAGLPHRRTQPDPVRVGRQAT